MNNIMVIVGARFLGHAFPLASMVLAIKAAANVSSSVNVQVHLVPLSGGPRPPAANYLKRCSDSVTVHEDLAVPLDKKGQIRDYYDLLLAQGLTNKQRQGRLITKVRGLINAQEPDLILTDSLPGVPQLATSMGIPVLAMRSHALLQRCDHGIWRDVFLDQPVTLQEIQQQQALFEHFQEVLSDSGCSLAAGSSIDGLYYDCAVATPGFEGFDVRPHAAHAHWFMRLGTLPDQIMQRSRKIALLYVRNEESREAIRAALLTSGYQCSVLDDNRPADVDLWNHEIDACLMVSHGGHGMVAAGMYQGIPHLVIADNDDRFTNGCRLERNNGGLCLDWRASQRIPIDTVAEALTRLPGSLVHRGGLNHGSVPAEDVAAQAITAAKAFCELRTRKV
jgi:hypothetical protein